VSKPVVFNDGDLEVLLYTHQYRVLQTPHLVSLCDRGNRALRRRLRLLYDHRYLDRIAPVSFNDPIAYSLGNRGADKVAGHLGIHRGNVDWVAKNRRLRRGFIDHTLFVSEFASWIIGTSRNDGLCVLTPAEITTDKSLRVRANTAFHGNWYQLSNTPDWIFSIGLEESDPSGKFYYVEVDRGTMPVSTSMLNRSSIEKKMAVYLASIRNGYHKDAFGQNNARVVWIIDTSYSGSKRLESLLETNRQLTGGRGSRVFLFALRKLLTNSPDIRGVRLINGRGEEVSLLG
jgi:Replication-relaxation